MKSLLFKYLILLSVASSVSALLPESLKSRLVFRRRLLPQNIHISNNSIEPDPGSYPPSVLQQTPIMGNSPSKEQDAKAQGPLCISDILAKTREVNIFSSLTRDIESVSTRLNNGTSNSVVLAPLNSAIKALPRKPWEDPSDYKHFGEEEAYAGKQGEGRAARNLRRFVEAHIVPESPWRANKQVKTVGGGSIYWKQEDDGKIYIYPSKIEVKKIMTQASNGEVWILKGVVNYI
ncbi:FAS1 domain-containing protein [Paracoccidioides lutzii Pb01]|uniref:FAS1 domain-containing protein n=1 Tax=Paracoccidioides lutzii (strain ATCC MYA-826 / Pb01) TaxID=502779 RepID=C1H1N8_PARBA|nr:FAS1 domain-containing protein [Paracoccidioides lutzii Pb01]EEH33775.1 FAS1 domain-containing protein [Paracoccidioides lutzii Pb01]